MPSRRPVSPQIVAAFARRLADYRLGGCPCGGGAAHARDVRNSAAAHGMSYSELWSEVHRLAYEIIDNESPGR